ncbi:MAG: NAD-binding protein [Candidatus Eisenbacteria bacterium]
MPGEKSTMYVIVAGCGRVGAQLAGFLSEEGHDVVVIDKDATSFHRLGSSFNGLTLEGVAFDEDLLLDAGVKSADAFLALTNYDNTNLMAAEIAKCIYEVPTVLSRVYYVEKELTFFKMGIDYVCSTTLTAERFTEKLFQGTGTISLQDRPELGVKLLEFQVRPEAAGRRARELDSGVNSRLVAVLRRGLLLGLDEDILLEPADRLVVALRKEGHQAVLECLGEGYATDVSCRFAAAFPTDASGALQDKPDSATVVIGGCSAVGAHLAFMLSMEGHDVTVIDEEPERFKRMPDNFTGRFVRGTVYEEETLLAAGIEEASHFAVLTKFDNANLMAAMVAQRVFNVPVVVARLFNTDKEFTYQALGIDFVCGTRLLSQLLLNRLINPIVHVRASCCNNLFDIVEYECPSRWAGKDIAQIENKVGFRLAYVARRQTGVLPTGHFKLGQGDVITALMPSRAARKLDRNLKKQMKG